VVLVSNLPEVRVTCDVLFTLFGVYGDVQRVKILYNKRDTALIQFLSPQSAYLAALHLNHLHLYGKQISVTPSKHVEVSLPKAAGHPGQTQADAEQQLSGLTQDYTHSPIHRFKRTAGAAGTTAAGGGLGIHAKSIHPPSQVLHVSSLADAVTEEELRQLFASQQSSAAAAANGEPNEEKEHARAIPVVQFFTSTPKPPPSAPLSAPAPKTSKQAFLRFDSVAAAVEALIDFHNKNLHGRYLRISFSGKDPAQVHDTINGQPIQPLHTQQGGGAGAAAAGPAAAGGVSPNESTSGPSGATSTGGAVSPNANGSPAATSPSAGAEGQAAHQE
jgi:RNA recognition motif-containing protein